MASGKDNSQKPSKNITQNFEGGVQRDGAEQAMDQEQAAVTQMGNNAQLGINEGGRTNDSSEQHNPEGAVHGLPKPALKGTWR